MLSLFAFEVCYIIIPAFILFFLFILPFPRLSYYVGRGVNLVERLNFHGVSLLLIVTTLTFVSFAAQFFELRKKYGQGKPRFADLSMEVDWEARKWRYERNMYIHALATVLCASIMKFARLHATLEKQTAPPTEEKKKA